MPRLFIPVGIPGCGKSTFAERILGGAGHISSDAIREELVQAGELESIGDMSKNAEVFDMYHERIRQYLVGDSYGPMDVVADATNLRDFAREKLRRIARDTGAETHLFVFTNLSAAVSRNQKRDRVVPPEAIVGMLEQYEKALKDIPSETYTSVTYIENVA